jgi:hypothetical protein
MYYGAMGDGVTDDTGALNAALSASRNVLFPAGTYLCANLAVPANTRIFGQEGARLVSKILSVGVGDPIINIYGDNVTIEGLYLDGRRALQPVDLPYCDCLGSNTTAGRAYRALITAYSVTGVTVRRCVLTGAYGAGLATGDANNVTFEENVATFNNFEAVDIYYLTSNLVRNSGHIIRNNRISNLETLGGGSVQPNAIIFSSSDEVVVTGNTIDYIMRNGVKAENGRAVTISDNIIRHVSVTDFSCIQLQGIAEDTVVSNNVLEYCSGIALFPNLDVSTIRGVVLTGNTIRYYSPWALRLNTGANTSQCANGVVMANNVLSDLVLDPLSSSLVTPVRVDGCFSALSITNNLVTQSTSIGTVIGTGIFYIDASIASCDSVMVTHNSIVASTFNGAGIRFASLNSATLFTNTDVSYNRVLVNSTGFGLDIYDGGVADIISGSFRFNTANRIVWNQGNMQTEGNVAGLLTVSSTINSQYRKVTTTPTTLKSYDSFVVVRLTAPAPSTITLPFGSTTLPGHVFFIKDGTGDAATNPITIVRQGSATFQGGGTSTVIDTNYGYIALTYSDAVSNMWITLDTSSGVTSVTGTTNQICSTGGSTPVLSFCNPTNLPGDVNALSGTFTAGAVDTPVVTADQYISAGGVPTINNAAGTLPTCGAGGSPGSFSVVGTDTDFVVTITTGGDACATGQIFSVLTNRSCPTRLACSIDPAANDGVFCNSCGTNVAANDLGVGIDTQAFYIYTTPLSSGTVYIYTVHCGCF